MEEEFYLNIIYKDQNVKFRVTNPMAPLGVLMTNVRHSVNQEGLLYFDFHSVDSTGAPLEYFFGKEDSELHEVRIMRPRVGKTDLTLADYSVKNGDTLYLIADPYPG